MDLTLLLTVFEHRPTYKELVKFLFWSKITAHNIHNTRLHVQSALFILPNVSLSNSRLFVMKLRISFINILLYVNYTFNSNVVDI